MTKNTDTLHQPLGINPEATPNLSEALGEPEDSIATPDSGMDRKTPNMGEV